MFTGVEHLLAQSTHDVKRILIVEDEDLIQMLLAAHLENLGFSAERAGTAAEAKKKLFSAGGSLDAAIIDLGLPDAKGDALVSELRAIDPTLPIVISTGYDRKTAQDRFVGVRDIDYLTKPYTQQQLSAALHRLGLDP